MSIVRRKIVVNKFIKLSIVIILTAVTVGGQCVGKVKLNPKRKLVLSRDGYYLFNPVWHPNGERIYYLAMPVSDPLQFRDQAAFSGSIWTVQANGTDERLVVSGNFSLLTIAPDGEKLAFVKGSYPHHSDENDNKIIVADISGMIMDTIQITGGEMVSWIKFGRNDDKIYYSTTIARDTVGYYRINLDGSGEEMLFTRYGLFYYFDLFPDGSLYTHYRVAPALHPQNSNYVVFPDEIKEVDLILKNLITGEADSLNAAPYGTPVYIDLPRWSPDGDKVIYCVGAARGPYLRISKLELWMVEGIELR